MSRDKTSTERARPGTDPRSEFRYEWHGDQPPTIAFVEAVADATGRDPVEMPPLYEYVDADALNELLVGSSDRVGTTTVTVRYDDVTGRFNSDGELVILLDGRSVE